MIHTLKITGKTSEGLSRWDGIIDKLEYISACRYQVNVGDIIKIKDEYSNVVHLLRVDDDSINCDTCPIYNKEFDICKYSVSDIKRGGLAVCRNMYALLNAETMLEDL